MSQEILNKKNINALATSEKLQRGKVQKLEEDIVQLRNLVTNLSQEVQFLKSHINIQRVMGATSK